MIMGESFWQKDSLITHILFELWLITLLWVVSVFLTQTLITISTFFSMNTDICQLLQGLIIFSDDKAKFFKWPYKQKWFNQSLMHILHSTYLTSSKHTPSLKHIYFEISNVNISEMQRFQSVFGILHNTLYSLCKGSKISGSTFIFIRCPKKWAEKFPPFVQFDFYYHFSSCFSTNLLHIDYRNPF